MVPVSRFFIQLYITIFQILNELIRKSVYCLNIQRYQATNIMWPRYHAHFAQFRYRKDLMASNGMLRAHARHGYLCATVSRQNTNHGSTKSTGMRCAQFKKISGRKIYIGTRPNANGNCWMNTKKSRAWSSVVTVYICIGNRSVRGTFRS